ncbi:GntR family transcriptional regulator [Bacteroides acidifaciens]|uniref:GntR family transcriptional regulator n=3 Tax=Bacteroides acidifaciens TaxID=85831 RepID=A0A7K3MFX4_9BACE|nr:GntR family transcriptional regulator [Bacteroides acidifaciens]MBF0731298.1 GntR family transcriptional regulator [Bacteroides acidifaciens]MBF0835135.1 GntR family transcriptional regulator [Bacteroides acidifaciens]MCR2007266.1 GntR family transcriptional regulator [Bacteroides acidifaciens]NDO53432.1 GntR family transcriptional regulator [Bacteroides acidifaciens]TFU45710.1 GntR family transcriptional regulator [Bacteroides acidifaciens]
MKRTDKKATFGQQSSKVTQLADNLSQAISRKEFLEGDSLPSINQLSAQYGVSRDTVFKAFLDLRERGLIDSTPGKGYYVTSQVTNVLLLLDQYTPFKEALYNSFVKHLPINYKVDLLFHQYNERLFNTIIRESIGKYNKYIVMNFDNEKFSTALNKINPARLLLLDFGKFEKEKYFYICQDFDESFYQALLALKERMHRYRQIVFLFSKGLKHPQSSKDYFIRFCEEQGFSYEIQEDIENLVVRKETAYIAIKQQDVVKAVKQGRLEGLKCGKDFGLLAYNDIPSYEVIDEGITSLSIDWEMMGNEAANFVLNDTPIQKYLPTEVKLRKSL